MGYYINEINGRHVGTSYTEKINSILAADGTRIPEPIEWKEGLVCVVDNGYMAAAAYAYSEREMEEFKIPDGRPKQWMFLENAKEFSN